ncbi:MAG: SUMF1/EgtB/PvdO family nonheme iron enzyme [Desulfobacteraceae bacterium]|nr:SUMF1/EgtB/PvdO family nonheme iron enzyme [Desulfobacteraceae bacterium]
MTTKVICPGCSEPVQKNWKICPVCETRLQQLNCPGCDQPVKENWNRCPGCESVLICPGCKTRRAKGQNTCAICENQQNRQAAKEDKPAVFTDTVCGLELVLVPGGSFQMGDTIGLGADSEKTVHKVVLDDFYICRYPVTQSQWLRIMEQNPSKQTMPDHPVEQVTWKDAIGFAEKLSQAYHGGHTFRLPTEAQWEYAARSGGNDELYAGGDSIDALAWYEENSGGRSHAVGTKAPNGLGIYDMSGNVWEWCLDTYHEDAYRVHAPVNPAIDAPGEGRVIRGGGWNLDQWSARCARRFNFKADFSGPALGFRLVKP